MCVAGVGGSERKRSETYGRWELYGMNSDIGGIVGRRH